ncbi:hypothetical protein EGR_11308 [Echinococcus granulosus]|uniref:Uncharacterized protein n=1 Tax=Echinococcus granulosus TaxID=6210 RepID=W6U050_ECHGR|nr:hypothetical protein EGR_11308 [Echinococcus granulosus]EUB53841.1 hypothetical protein EGR_11308 [Echinococcus granulosus]
MDDLDDCFSHIQLDIYGLNPFGQEAGKTPHQDDFQITACGVRGDDRNKMSLIFNTTCIIFSVKLDKTKCSINLITIWMHILKLIIFKTLNLVFFIVFLALSCSNLIDYEK